MFENTDLPRVVRVKSTAPVTDELEAFDMLSRFLASEKAKQLSHDFAGQAYLASSSQTWNDLRLACNSLLEHNDPRREPVAAWKEQVEETPMDSSSPETPLPVKEEPASDSDIVKTEDIPESDLLKIEKSAKKSAKKAKKEAKKIKKAAKKEKKEKKRKREEE